MHKLLILSLVVLGGGWAARAQSVDVTSLEQSSDGTVTVSYTLDGDSAIVTMDVETNRGDGVWLSIGGENVSGRCPPAGDVFRLVSGAGPHEVRWDPDYAWPDSSFSAGDSNARITLRAWAPDDAPDYLVLSLATNETHRIAYYPSADYLPSGLLSNRLYRTEALVMRRIHAKDVTWTMGTTSGLLWWVDVHNPAHAVTLDHDYYIGVFQLTVAQKYAFWGAGCVEFAGPAGEGRMRPVDQVSYGILRLGNSDKSADVSAMYPHEPAANSILGLLRTHSRCAEAPDGLAFDLPSEAEWEFACKGGVAGEMYWNNGAIIGNDAGNADAIPGRCLGNQSVKSSSQSSYPVCVGTTNATATCGSYAPNGFGLYDMHGNILEICLDWYSADIASLGGAVNAYEDKLADRTTASSGSCVVRGGSWESDSYQAQSEYRTSREIGTSWRQGVRLVIRPTVQNGGEE